MYTDASLKGLGYVLIKDGKVVVYAFKQLRPQEENYLTHDLELSSVMFVLKIYRHYLYGSQFEIFNDHNCLKNLSGLEEIE